jgi:hypothetical protein
MRLTVLPVYLFEKRKSNWSYAPGIYDLRINEEPSTYVDALDNLLDPNELSNQLHSKWNDELNSRFNFENVVNETLELLQQTDVDFENFESLGRFSPNRFKPFYSGTKGKPTSSSPLATYKPKPISLEFSFFRIYGILYANDVFLVAKIDIKTTLKSDPLTERYLKEMLHLLDTNEVTLNDFQDDGFTFSTP